MLFFWVYVYTPFNTGGVNQGLGGTYCFNLQDILYSEHLNYGANHKETFCSDAQLQNPINQKNENLWEDTLNFMRPY
jgi:hypothetical protein